MENSMGTLRSSFPPNYVTLKQLQELRLREKQQKEQEEEKRRLQQQREEEEEAKQPTEDKQELNRRGDQSSKSNPNGSRPPPRNKRQVSATRTNPKAVWKKSSAGEQGIAKPKVKNGTENQIVANEPENQIVANEPENQIVAEQKKKKKKNNKNQNRAKQKLISIEEKEISQQMIGSLNVSEETEEKLSKVKSTKQDIVENIMPVTTDLDKQPRKEIALDKPGHRSARLQGSANVSQRKFVGERYRGHRGQRLDGWKGNRAFGGWPTSTPSSGFMWIRKDANTHEDAEA